MDQFGWLASVSQFFQTNTQRRFIDWLNRQVRQHHLLPPTQELFDMSNETSHVSFCLRPQHALCQPLLHGVAWNQIGNSRHSGTTRGLSLKIHLQPGLSKRPSIKNPPDAVEVGFPPFK